MFSRTRDLYKDFALSLSVFDEVVLTEIYPAREEPIPGVTSKLIYDDLQPNVEKWLIESKDVLDFVRDHEFDVLVLLGAGNLDDNIDRISELLKERV